MPQTQPLPEIVKLGGSLVSHPRLTALLSALARRGAPLVLVTGGGPLADGVRALQPRLGLSDAACHRMAILAMEQTALAFADIAPGLMLADTPEAIVDAHAQGRAALWAPARMALAARELPESWDLTSDSLAAWLAVEIGAARLTLVKSAPAPGPAPADWAASGLVDPLFPSFAAHVTGAVEIVTIDAMVASPGRGSLAA
ncbi:aspartate/glutamate/uridylate kinase [Ancylobacter novellus DSM 506]|uniref:Aspartate/glutamate/uridylate kinase n=1 Tax=Ancylobacter novellus (strain ATCC 8093 / DSM 506 / JCM 20403 / CCM 1077 / IAM 12100 / NBRC 12443 / NCIMB 10456) TaxID=639283 RepID=D7A5H2_ANCN5|nr:aspartate/glutamate/uridylate kinase [Ancylobacter novellus]ADH88096.1 aspartate/glutamate/uridylate kinase [Ancylobacter novellus DSM 506]